MRNFFNLIKRQFGVNIKGFWIDSAKYFCNHELKEFFENEGIKHETSCSYTPQKNGVAERKIGATMDKRRALMADVNCPKHRWGFSIKNAIHLINRLPLTRQICAVVEYTQTRVKMLIKLTNFDK